MSFLKNSIGFSKLIKRSCFSKKTDLLQNHMRWRKVIMPHVLATKLFKINDMKMFQSIKQIHKLLVEIISQPE